MLITYLLVVTNQREEEDAKQQHLLRPRLNMRLANLENTVGNLMENVEHVFKNLSQNVSGNQERADLGALNSH